MQNQVTFDKARGFKLDGEPLSMQPKAATLVVLPLTAGKGATNGGTV